LTYSFSIRFGTPDNSGEARSGPEQLRSKVGSRDVPCNEFPYRIGMFASPVGRKRVSMQKFSALRWLATLCVLLVCSVSLAQGSEEMEKRYQEKRAKKFVQKIEWVTSLDQAKAISKQKNLPILAYFTRSYAP
jgi:hypothetical protein